MRELRTEIKIAVPPERVWAVLTDTASYPAWNPFIRRLDGRLAVGERLTALLQPEGKRATSFRPRVQAFEPARQLRWLGRLFVPGLFDGEHIFELEPLPDGCVRFVQRERFSGVLAGPVLRSIGDATRRGFEAMNAALKTRVEDSSATESRAAAATHMEAPQ